MNWKRAAVLALLLLAVLSPAWSDIRSAASANRSKKLCYCDCGMKAGAKMCAEMCELPKYQDRWWAASCLKKLRDALAPAAPVEHSHSKKNNRVQDARL